MKHSFTALFLIAAAAHAQTTTPLIRTESRTVLVDAVATQKGKFATGLTAKDFHVSEDGKEQKISGFSVESSSITAERPGKHYIAFLFDTAAFPRSLELAAHQMALQFLKGYASPDRYIAVVNHDYSGTQVFQNFTTDPAKLKKAFSLMPTRSTVETASQDTNSYRAMLEGLETLANSMASIRGRKALIFFTTAPPPNPELEADVNRAIAALNKANVAVYTVAAAAGAAGSDSNRVMPGTLGSVPGLMNGSSTVLPPFAENTGGLAFVLNNDLVASLGRVAQEQDWYYLLSYTPSENSPEGSCHTLRVKVDRGGVDVRARKAYCTTSPSGLSDVKAQGADIEAKAAGAAPTIPAKIQLPWFYSSPGIARVHLAMDINPSSIKFKRDKGKLHAELTFAGAALLPDNSVAARVNDTVKLDFDNDQQVEAFLKAPYHYENQFEMAPGKYRLTMSFLSDSGAFGKVESPLDVAPWDGKSLGLSAPALSHSARRSEDIADGLDESLIEGSRPLVAGNTEIIPAGDPAFQPGGTAVVYFEAYEPLLASAKWDAPPQVGIRVRVLDAGGNQKSDTGVQSVARFMRAGNPVIPVATAIPISGLAPGNYTLELTALRPGGQPIIRTAAFELR